MERAQKDGSAVILVVDDEESMRCQLSDAVEVLGHACLVAEHAEKALEVLAEHAVDVVLTDIKMPGMSGLDLLARVRAETSSDVVMMTGYMEEFTYDRILELGASDFIYKPVSLKELRVRLKRVLRERRLLRERMAAQEELTEANRQLTRYAEELAKSLSELKEAHNQLLKARKLESIGQLAAGIAHEINTPMQYVSNNTEYVAGAFEGVAAAYRQCRDLAAAAREKPVAPAVWEAFLMLEEEHDAAYAMEEIPEALAQTMEGVDRINRIVQSIKQFAHPGSEKRTPIDLNKAVESTITVARGEWKHTASVETALDPALPPVRCVLGEINQVILNLIVNATHAIAGANREREQPGRIRIATRWLPETGEVEIEVADNGTGIPAGVQPRIFDPFFTTKDVGVGTGQGLAIAHTIVVEKHNGAIDFTSEPGRGTTFVVRLPVGGGEEAA